MADKGEDCYFYFYSTCKKGSSCPFRHSEAAKGTEIVCSTWEKRAQCPKSNCQYRHTVIYTPRSTIDCYWEKQPGGCKKPHCTFKHSKPKPKIESDTATSSVKPRVTRRLSRSGLSGTAGDNVEKKTLKLNRLVGIPTTEVGSGCFSDSELTSKRRKLSPAAAPSKNDVQNTAFEMKYEIPKETETDMTSTKRKIFLRKPGATGKAADTVKQEEPRVKLRRAWKRSSVSPTLLVASAVEEVSPAAGTIATEMEQAPMAASSGNGAPAADEDSKSAPRAAHEETGGLSVPTDSPSAEKRAPAADNDEEYKRTLIDIFGRDLADIYLSQGIRLDLSQYLGK